MNLAQYATTVLNAKLTKPETNLLTKLSDSYGIVVTNPNPTVEVLNPISGVSRNVNPLIATLVRFTYRAYSTYDFKGGMTFNGVPVNISIYDRVRYLVLKLDNKAYAELLD